MSKHGEDITKELVKKTKALEYAAINDTPEDIAQIYAKLGNVEYSARALGVACRFRGAECVRALVKHGASFHAPLTNYMVQLYGSYGDYFPVLLLDNFPEKGITYFVVTRQIYKSVTREDGTVLSPLTFEKRVEVLDYLHENAERVGFDINELLFYAIMLNDEPMTRELEKRGAELSESRKTLLSDKGKPKDLCIWTVLLERLSAENFVPVLTRLKDRLGRKFHCTVGIYDACFDKLHTFENLDFYFNYFDDPKVSKTAIMKNAVEKDCVGGLIFAEREGWLSSPKKRDEMIEYAAEKKAVECLARLLDFKNRTADLAAERAKAEKKLEREFNADPNSVTELKKNWSFTKKSDGTLVITGYKGSSPVLNVPQRIGNAAVTEIGDWALSPHASRIKEPTREFRKTITKITLPEGLKKIGASAFRGLASLESVNIPETVISIGETAFSDCCSLKTVIVPEGVRHIDANAFSMQHGMGALEYVELPRTLEYFREECEWVRVYLFRAAGCPKLVVGVPHAPHVEEFCEHNRIKFKYYDE